MSDDTFNDHLSAMKDHSHEHMGHWVEHQKMIFKKWRKIIEERADDDKDFFKQWSKSWMATGFQMLEMQNESLQMVQQTRLDHIDSFLKYLDTIDCTNNDDDTGQTKSP